MRVSVRDAGESGEPLEALTSQSRGIPSIVGLTHSEPYLVA